MRPIAAFITATLLAGCSGSPEGVVWQHRASWHVLPKAFILDDMETPVVAGDVAIFCGGNHEARKSHIGALRLSDGKLLWKHVVGTCESAALVMDSTAVGFGSHDEYQSLKAVDIESGRLLWHRKFARSFQAHPVAQHGFLYITRADSLWRIHTRSGAVERAAIPGYALRDRRRGWLVSDSARVLLNYGRNVYAVDGPELSLRPLVELEEEYRYTEFFTLRDDALFVVSRGRNSVLGKFSLKDGRLLWKFTPGTAAAPAVANGVVYVPGGGALVALADSTGQELWRTPARALFTPLYTGNALYVDGDEEIIRIDPATGAVTERFDACAEVGAAPAVAGDKLLYGNLYGSLYAVRMR